MAVRRHALRYPNMPSAGHTFLKADQGATSSMYRLPLLEMANAASKASCILKSS